MSGIPEDEIDMEIRRMCGYDKFGDDEHTNYMGEGIHHGIDWAERFWWDAREVEPTPELQYLVYKANKWLPMMALGQGRWRRSDTGTRLEYEKAPYYKPMPPGPEDD